MAETTDPPPISVRPLFFGPADRFAFVLWEGDNLKVAQAFTDLAGQ